jgi:hypothetical protein
MALNVWTWQSGVDQYGNPIIEKALDEPGFTPPDGAELVEQDPYAWWDEIKETGKGKRYLKPIADAINDGRKSDWSVSRRQLREALIRLNMLTTIESAIRNQNALIQNWWDTAAYFERFHPMIEAMVPVLGLTDSQVDDVFAMADTL